MSRYLVSTHREMAIVLANDVREARAKAEMEFADPLDQMVVAPLSAGVAHELRGLLARVKTIT